MVKQRKVVERPIESPFPKAVTSRTDRLVEIADHCASAQDIAEALGEHFLAYLLSMVAQETAAATGRVMATAAATPAKRRSQPPS